MKNLCFQKKKKRMVFFKFLPKIIRIIQKIILYYFRKSRTIYIYFFNQFENYCKEKNIKNLFIKNQNEIFYQKKQNDKQVKNDKHAFKNQEIH